MRLDVHHHQVPDRQILQRLDMVLIHLQAITRNTETIMATLDELLAAVRTESGQIESITVLVNQLHEQVKGLTTGMLPPDVQKKIDEAFAAVTADKGKLEEAINANGDKAKGADVPAGTSGKTPAGVPIDAPPPANPDSFAMATGQPPRGGRHKHD